MKKVNRSLLALVLIFAMLLSAFPAFAGENEKVEIASVGRVYDYICKLLNNIK